MPKVADFIESHREQLVERYAQDAGRLESARGLKPYELIDTFPEYLATLATISRQGHRGDPVKTKKRLEETHISLRLRHGYSQEEVTSEYALMARLISSLWESLPPEEQPTPEDTGLLLEELQDAMSQVVATFSGYTLEDRQAEKRTLRRLDALAPESLVRGGNPSSLHPRLAPLVQVIQDALGADGAELLLADASGTQLELVTATGACPEPSADYRTPVGAPSFVARVAAADEPVLLADVRTTSLELRDELRRSGLRSLMGEPLPSPHGGGHRRHRGVGRLRPPDPGERHPAAHGGLHARGSPGGPPELPHPHAARAPGVHRARRSEPEGDRRPPALREAVRPPGGPPRGHPHQQRHLG
jgi:hypothetical protein